MKERMKWRGEVPDGGKVGKKGSSCLGRKNVEVDKEKEV